MIPGVLAGALTGGGGWSVFTADGKSPPAIVAGTHFTRVDDSDTYANARLASPLTGKRYFSTAITFAAAGSVLGVGFVDETSDISSALSYVGQVGSGAAWGPADAIYVDDVEGASVSLGASLEWAVDASTRSVWLRDSGSAWIGGGDPAAGTSPTFAVPGTGAMFFAASLIAGSGADAREVVVATDPIDITGTPPAGFTAGYPA